MNVVVVDAAEARARLCAGTMTPSSFREALLSVPAPSRDAWVDEVFAIDEIPDDGPELPRGCVPYLPCAVDDVIAAIDVASVGPDDVFVDVGAGVGRVAVLAALVSGCRAVAVEVQGALAARAAELAAAFANVDGRVIHGDVAALADDDAAAVAVASVYFLYCPFSGARLDAFVDSLEGVARRRPIHIVNVDAPLPSRPWLDVVVAGPRLSVLRSVVDDE